MEEIEPRILYSADVLPDAPIHEEVQVVNVEAEVSISENTLTTENTAQTALASVPSGGNEDFLILSAQGESLPSHTEQEQRTELIIVDENVADYQLLIDGFHSEDAIQYEVLLLNSTSDPFNQINVVMAEQPGLNAVHLLSHGDDSRLQLGNIEINLNTISSHRDAFKSWSAYLDQDADFLIYGCDLATTPEGTAMMELMGLWTEMDVAASIDATGHTSLGGDWELEHYTGDIESSLPVTASAQDQWLQLLATSQELSSEGNGSAQAIAMDAIGNYVVAYSADKQDGNGWGVYAQRYSSDGTATGSEIIVNQVATDDQRYASVGMNDSGDFVVTWTSLNQDGTSSSVYARQFNADGSAFANEFRLNTTSTGSQSNASIDVDSSGNFIAVWQGNGPSDSDGVFFRRFNADGSAIDASDMLAHAASDGTTSEHDPVVAWQTAGKFVIAWDQGSYAKFNRFDASGNALGTGPASIDSGTLPSNSAGLSIDANASGAFAVAYKHEGLGSATYLRVFNEDGSLAFTESNPVTSWTSIDGSHSLNPSVALRDSGSVVVVYQTSASGGDINLREINADGSYAGSPVTIVSQAGDQNMPAIAMAGPDDFAVVWSDTVGASVSTSSFVANSSPLIAVNNGLTVNEGSSNNVISRSRLEEGDTDDSGAELTYTVSALPAHGVLQLSSVTLSLNDTFTQADIDNNLLTYDHDGSETNSDSFDFSLADGGENSSVPITGTFVFTITAANDAPLIDLDVDDSSTATGAHFVAIYADNIVIADSDLSITDVDSVTLTLSISAGNISDGVDEIFVVGNTSFPIVTDTSSSGVTAGGVTVDLTIASQTLTITASGGGGLTLADTESVLADIKYLNSATPTTGSGTRTFDISVNDGTDSSNIAVTTLSLVNNPPTAATGGPYSISEGDVLNLDASGSSDVDGDSLSYQWDLDNDGVYGDVDGVSVAVDWATLQSFGIDDDGTYTLGVEVSDSWGSSHTASASLTVINTAPVLSATGDSTVRAGTLYTLDLLDSDPGDDAITSWTVNWGDGNVQTYLGDPDTVSHSYANTGFTYNISISATDEDNSDAYLHSDLFIGNYKNNSGVFTVQGDWGNSPSEFGTEGTLDKAIQPIIGPDGMLYVSGESSKNIVRFNASTGVMDSEFSTIAGSAGGIAFGPDGNLYVADYDNKNVIRIDASTGASLGDFVADTVEKPYGLIFGPDGHLYVGLYDTAEVVKYDGATGALLGTFVTANAGGLDKPEQMTFGPDGHLYIADASSSNNNVLKFDGSSGLFISEFVTNGDGGLDQPNGIAFGPDGMLYVTDSSDGDVLRYDGSTGSYIDTYASGLDKPSLITFRPDLQILVSSSNTAPSMTSPAAYSVTENQTAAGSAAGNDADGDDLAFSISGGNDAALFTIDANTGALSFNSAPDFETPTDSDTNGVYELQLTVDDGYGGSDTQSLSITVLNSDESYTGGVTLDANTPVVGTILSASHSISEPDGIAGSMTWQWLRDGSVISGATLQTYTVASADLGSQLSARANYTDGAGSNIFVTSSLSNAVVNPSNQSPTATTDSYAINEDSILNIDAGSGLLSNDVDTDGDSFNITDYTQPDHGALVVNADGSFVYTPDAQFNGSDQFNYLIDDGQNAVSNTWNLNGDLLDSTGTDNGSVSGATGTDGQFGEGLYFDGSATATLPDIDYGDHFTLSLWFRLDDNAGTGYDYLYSHGAPSNTNSINVYFIEDNTSTSTSNNLLRTIVRDSNDGFYNDTLDIDVPSNGLADGQWHQYTLTVDSSAGLAIYIDGTQMATHATYGADGVNPGNDITLGLNPWIVDGTNRHLEGGIDQIQLLSQALDSSEVSALHSSSGSVNISVAAVNDSPDTTGINDFSTLENSADKNIDLSGIFSDIEDSSTDLVFSITANSNPGLVSASVDNTTDTLTLSYTASSVGSATLEVTATDSSGAQTSTSFTASVLAVEGVTHSLPSSQILLEDGFREFSTINGNAISVSLGISSDDLVRVSLGVAQGTLALASTTGITLTAGADNSANMTLVGLESAINLALDGLRYTPLSDVFGSDSLSITSDMNINLQGQFTFSNTSDLTEDSSYNGLIGGLPGGVTSTVDPFRNEVAQFDGSSVMTINSTFGNPADLTLSAWVNLDAGAQNAEVFSIGNGVGLRLDDSVNGPGVTAYYEGSSTHYTSSNTQVAGTGWHHVAYVVDSGANTQALYVDGIQVATSAHTDAINYSDTVTTFGGRNSAPQHLMLGQLDNMRIYDRVLNAEEINALAIEQSEISDSIDLNVTAVNDSPNSSGIATQVIAEDAANQSIELRSAFSDIEDSDDALSFSVQSNSNPPLLSSVHINNSNGSIAFTPATNQNGSATLTIRATDSDGAWTETDLIISVTAINDAPTITTDAIMSSQENQAEVVTLTAEDVDSSITSLTYLIVGGADASGLSISSDGILNFNTPPDYEAPHDSNADGVFEVRVRVTDDFGSSDELDLRIDLTNEYEASRFSAPLTPISYTEDTPLSLADIVVANPDNNPMTVTVTLNDPGAGTISNAIQGAALTPQAASSWQMTGSVADLNTAISELFFVPTLNQSGPVVLHISLDDGTRIVTGEKILSGIPVADPPQVGNSIGMVGTPTAPISILPNPDDGAEVTHFRISNITHGTLTLADGSTPVNNGDFISFDDAQNGLIFTSTVPLTGSFIVEASEDGQTLSAQSLPVTATIEIQTPIAIVDTGTTTAETEVIDSEIQNETPTQETQTDQEFDFGPLIGKEDPAKPRDTSDQNSSDTAVFAAARDASSTAAAPAEDAPRNMLDVKHLERGQKSSPILFQIMLEGQKVELQKVSEQSFQQLAIAFSQMDQETEKMLNTQLGAVGSAVTVATGMSVGYVVWMFRGGMLMSSLLFSLPAWQVADPLPILNATRKSRDGDDESLQSLIEKRSKKTKSTSSTPDNGAEEDPTERDT